MDEGGVKYMSMMHYYRKEMGPLGGFEYHLVDHADTRVETVANPMADLSAL